MSLLSKLTMPKQSDLDKTIEAARSLPPMTREEFDAQRRTYVRGEMGIGSDRDEAAMSAAVASGDQEEIERLEKAAEDRMKAVDDYFERGF